MTQTHTLYVFGTGNATMTRYYNTCFAIRSGEEYFMTDAGGGNGILRILEEMQVPLNRIHHLFVTHEHTDHILGVIWMIRMIGTAIKKGNYEGIFHIYCHDGLIDTIQTFCRLTLQKKFCDLIGDPIQLIPISDRETRQILDMEVTFFDIIDQGAPVRLPRCAAGRQDRLLPGRRTAEPALRRICQRRRLAFPRSLLPLPRPGNLLPL